MSAFATVEFHELVLQASERLRPLPKTVSELARVAADETSSIQDISAIVSGDVFLTAALLREANSAASGSVEEIDEVGRAVIRLGTARVVAVSVASCLVDVGEERLDGYSIDRDRFWGECRARSLVAEVIVGQSTAQVGPSSVTAALLQDIGKVVLSPYLTAEHYTSALATHGDEVVAERELIDLDHAQVGANLAEIWDLPASIVEGIRGHHLQDGGESDGARVAFVADRIATMLGLRLIEPGLETAGDSRFVTALDDLGVELDPLLAVSRRRLGLDEDD